MLKPGTQSHFEDRHASAWSDRQIVEPRAHGTQHDDRIVVENPPETWE